MMIAPNLSACREKERGSMEEFGWMGRGVLTMGGGGNGATHH